MQLPRGTFHSIKKHVTFHSVMDEAVTLRLTGSIVVSFPQGRAFLVLEEGSTVLAAFQGLCGKDAFQMMEGAGDVRVDAELTTLNNTQLALAKEFNKSCQTAAGSGSAIVFGKKEALRPFPPPANTPAARLPSPPRRTYGGGETENQINDLDALDHIDLDKISGKFRVNAESIARELKLDHMMQD
jgi:hypothetical protein